MVNIDEGGAKAVLSYMERKQRRTNIIVGVTVGAIAAFFLGRFIYRKIKENEENKQRKKQLESEIATSNLSYSDSEYTSMADKVEEAVSGGGTDEAAIYTVFMRMKTNADVIKLQSAYGVRFKDEDMFDSIRRDMSSDEIAKINKILTQRNITVRV